jgi:hypothetical protein
VVSSDRGATGLRTFEGGRLGSPVSDDGHVSAPDDDRPSPNLNRSTGPSNREGHDCAIARDFRRSLPLRMCILALVAVVANAQQVRATASMTAPRYSAVTAPSRCMREAPTAAKISIPAAMGRSADKTTGNSLGPVRLRARRFNSVCHQTSVSAARGADEPRPQSSISAPSSTSASRFCHHSDVSCHHHSAKEPVATVRARTSYD